MEKSKLVPTWINSNLQNTELEKSLLLKNFDKIFDLILAPYQAPIESIFLVDYNEDCNKHFGQPLLFRDGYFTLSDTLAGNPKLIHLPSQRKVILHHRLSRFIPGSCWSNQELYLFEHLSLSPDPFKRLLLIPHPYFREETVSLDFFKNFISENREHILKYQRVFFLKDTIDYKLFTTVARLFFTELGRSVEAKSFSDLIYHDNPKNYAICDLGDGYITLDDFVIHAFLRRGACFWAGHKFRNVSCAKFYPFSAFHGISVWKRDSSQDLLEDWGPYLTKHGDFTPGLYYSFIEERLSKKEKTVELKPFDISFFKKIAFRLAHLTEGKRCQKIHKMVIRFQKKVVQVGLMFLVGRNAVKWKGSTVEKKNSNIFINDIDWNIYLSNTYSDYFLDLFRRVLSVCRFVMPNLDIPEIYIQSEREYQDELQLYDDLRYWPVLFRTLKKISKECRKLENCTNRYDLQKIYTSLKNSMMKLGQEHEKSQVCFFPLTFDFNYFLNSHDWDLFLDKSKSEPFDRNIYSPYLDLHFNGEDLFEWKVTDDALQVLISVLPDATLADLEVSKKLRLNHPKLCDVYLLGLSDDWMLGRSVYRSSFSNKNKIETEKLIKHLAFLKKEFSLYKNNVSETFKRTDLYQKMLALYQEQV